MENKFVLFGKYHWFSLGVLVGVSLMTAAIWYVVPSRAQTMSIPIQNPSFEMPAPPPNTSNSIPGWTVQQAPGGGSGVLEWATAPDGRNVALLAYGSSMFQDLHVLPQVGVYTLTFYTGNWFYSYSASYVVSILMGQKPVCSTQGYARGDFTRITLSCPMPGSHSS